MLDFSHPLLLHIYVLRQEGCFRAFKYRIIYDIKLPQLLEFSGNSAAYATKCGHFVQKILSIVPPSSAQISGQIVLLLIIYQVVQFFDKIMSIHKI